MIDFFACLSVSLLTRPKDLDSDNKTFCEINSCLTALAELIHQVH